MEAKEAQALEAVSLGQLRDELDKALLDEDKMREVEGKLSEQVLKELEQEEEEIKRENLARRTAPGFVDILWDRIDGMRHLLVGVLWAYCLGYFGFHLFWALFLFYFLYVTDAKYKKRGFQHFYRMKKTRTKTTKAVDAVEESADWFNHLMAALWPNVSNFAAVETKRFMGQFIADTLKASPPPGVKEVYVRNITLGLAPPEIKLLKPYRFPDRPNVYQLDLDLKYDGQMEITLVAVVGSTSKMKMPITLHDVKVYCPMRFVMEFYPQNPFLKTMDVQFRSIPPDWLSFGIKAKVLGAMNLLSLPGINSWVVDTITASIKDTMEFPKKITVNMAGEDADLKEPDAKELTTASKRELVPSVRLKQGERNVFKRYKGHVKVTLVEARNLLKTDRFGATDAYCKLMVGDVWFKSPTVANTLDPIWNTSYEFPLEEDDPDPKLSIMVKDWDVTGRNGLQGTCEIAFAKSEREKRMQSTADIIHPERPTKATLTVITTYCPDRDLEAPNK